MWQWSHLSEDAGRPQEREKVMIEKIFDAFISAIFSGLVLFSAGSLYNGVKRAALVQVSHGLSSTYRYSQALTGERFNWEK